MKNNGKYGFLGEFVKVPNGKPLALVECRYKQFHIYLDGTKAYPQTFDYASAFNEKGAARVKKDGEEFFINPKGERI